MANTLGRPTLFTPDTRARIIEALSNGASVKDASAIAGVGESTLLGWLEIATAIELNEIHPRAPQNEEARQSFLDFSRAVKKARSEWRLKAGERIILAGVERWIHRQTGTVRYEPPG